MRAWATEAGLALGQVTTEVKSNEIVAIPVLLRYLELKGAIITIDAMGCQLDIAAQIVEQGGDYVLAVKGNQASLHERIVDFFDTARANDLRGVTHTYYEQTDAGHGRVEVCRCWASEHLESLAHREHWAGLKSLAMVEGERHMEGKISVERRYFIASLAAQAEPIARAVRAHWQVENGCHWVLDMTFREDDSRIRRGDGAENFSTLRHFALNLLKQHAPKLSVRKKRIRAGFSDPFASNSLQVRLFKCGCPAVYADRFTKTETDDHGQESEREIHFMKGYTVSMSSRLTGCRRSTWLRRQSKPKCEQIVEDASQFQSSARARSQLSLQSGPSEILIAQAVLGRA